MSSICSVPRLCEDNCSQNPSTCTALQPVDNVETPVSNVTLEPGQLLSEDYASVIGKDFRDNEDEFVYRILSVRTLGCQTSNCSRTG